MEVTINADVLIKLAGLLVSLGTIGGIFVWGVKFVERQNQQDKELKAIRNEQTIICYGIMSCLRGLKEQGCNGPVTEALNKMEAHLNKAAHEEEG